MGQAAEEQLTRDIEARRAELSRDNDALTDKVSPAQIMERRKEATHSRFRSMRDKVMAVRRTPGTASATRCRTPPAPSPAPPPPPRTP